MFLLITSIFLIVLLLIGVYVIIKPPLAYEEEEVDRYGTIETRYSGTPKFVQRIGGAVLVLLTGGVLFFMSLTSVGATEVGVPITLGKPGDPLSPGPHLILPWTSVKTLDVKTQVMNLDADNEIKTITADRIQTPIDISVYYRVDNEKAATLLLTVGEDYPEKIVLPLSRSFVYDEGASYEAYDIQNQRENYEAAVESKLSVALAARGIILENIEIRKINLPESILENAQAKINAEEALRRAEIDAERKVVEAKAQAEANKILAESIEKNPDIICQQFVEGLRAGEIQGPIYVNPCVTGQGGTTPLLVQTK